jgi:pyruvate dehydrogenase E2 component (dihydrolipoamide acetyltransferase)
MPTNVIMPALELAQESGKVLRWLKAPGDRVQKGDPLVEIETDKITTELEAPESGILGEVTAREGDVVPVGQTIARIVESVGAVAAAAGGVTARGAAAAAAPAGARAVSRADGAASAAVPSSGAGGVAAGAGGGPGPSGAAIKASPLARKLAEQHGVDLAQIKASGGTIQKADVLAYVESRKAAPAATNGAAVRLIAASPKARRLADERGLDVSALSGSGPGGAVLAADVAAAARPVAPVPAAAVEATPRVEALPVAPVARPEAPGISTVWRIMAERMTASWTTAPHFYLVREVNVSRLATWRERASKQTTARITYTDLLVKLVAAALARHPAVNASWKDGAIVRHVEVNIGLAVAIDDGLIVPVIHRADTLSLAEIATRREDVVSRGQAGKLRPADIQGGVFTISNLGMYGVDAFNAIVNPPQAAILAVGRIADRVVAVNGQPSVQPTMVLTLSCDHRALDGARAAQFLGALADLVEEPLALLL